MKLKKDTSDIRKVKSARFNDTKPSLCFVGHLLISKAGNEMTKVTFFPGDVYHFGHNYSYHFYHSFNLDTGENGPIFYTTDNIEGKLMMKIKSRMIVC